MASKPSQNESLLTLDHVRAKRMAIDAAEREIERLANQLKADRLQFDAMLMFVPVSQREYVFDDPEEPPQDLFDQSKSFEPTIKLFKRHAKQRPARGDFSADVTVLVEQAGLSGMTHSELKREVAKIGHEDRLLDEAKGYHRVVSKMVARSDLMRHGTRLYSPAAYAKLEKSGKLPVIDETAPRENTGAAIALDILASHPDGLTGTQLKELVAAHPEAPQSISAHGQYIYNILAPLVGHGRVAKEGGVYKITDAGKATHAA